MRIGVLLKGVPFAAPRVRIRIREDGLGLDLGEAGWSLNPFDRDALDWGTSLRAGGEMVILTCGPASMDAVIRRGLAHADRATRIALDNSDELHPLAVAELLAAVITQEDFEILLAGREAIDTNGNQLPQIVAELLGWPQATNVTGFEPQRDSGRITVHRTLRPGTVERVELELPAVISVESQLPQGLVFPSLKDILLSKKKTISVIPPPDVESCAPPVVQVSRRLWSRGNG